VRLHAFPRTSQQIAELHDEQVSRERITRVRFRAIAKLNYAALDQVGVSLVPSCK